MGQREALKDTGMADHVPNDPWVEPPIGQNVSWCTTSLGGGRRDLGVELPWRHRGDAHPLAYAAGRAAKVPGTPGDAGMPILDGLLGSQEFGGRLMTAATLNHVNPLA